MRRVIIFTQRCIYANHGKICLVIEYWREGIGEKRERVSLRGLEQNPYQWVVSINKSRSLIKTSAIIYGFYNVWNTILSTSISIYLVLTITNKVQDDLLCLYCIWLAHLFLGPLANIHLPQMPALVALCFLASQTSSDAWETLSPHADMHGSRPQPMGDRSEWINTSAFFPLEGLLWEAVYAVPCTIPRAIVL